MSYRHNFHLRSSVSTIFGNFQNVKHLSPVILLLLLWPSLSAGQDHGTLTGTVRDSLGNPVELANVTLMGTGEGTMTRTDGTFRLEVPSGRSYTLVVSCVGFRSEQFPVRIQAGEEKQLEVNLNPEVRSLQEVSISSRQERGSTFQRIDVEDLTYMPTPRERLRRS
jgi:iron complex outermembrane receptor protein